ncbi:MAG: hypothetical protein ACTHKC_03415 [Candidatus Nitrosocosmicus sp.]
MTVVSDSFMGMFLPFDIYKRVSEFLDGNLNFPFVNKDEVMGIFFLFGKRFGVRTPIDILSVKDLARRTIEQIKREIFLSKPITNSNIELLRENYQKRILQIYVESQNESLYDESGINDRISRDPSILISCYCQHLAYYNQKCFFEIFDPFKKNQLDEQLHPVLVQRMVMLSYNFESPKLMPFSSLDPFLKWIKIN